jgi:serine/threonine-protein kinase
LHHCLARDLSRRYATADELMYDLEYYIYRGGYGPTNETLGKFIRELFGHTEPSAVVVFDARGSTQLLEHTARLRAKK